MIYQKKEKWKKRYRDAEIEINLKDKKIINLEAKIEKIKK
jgi:hypothetical protein